MLVFDLEDTLFDIEGLKTPEIKSWGRNELIEFSYLRKDLPSRKKIGVRVNRPNSAEFDNDIFFLSQLSKNWNIEAIVIPKVETTRELNDALYQLKEHKISYNRYIPIVETIQGMKNLSSIASHPGLQDIIYGHNDYSLEMGHWPFFDEEEEKFWEIVTPFIQTIEKAGLSYVHPPIFSLSNESFFKQIVSRLKNSCRHPFGMITINSTQTILLNQLTHKHVDEALSPLRTITYSMNEKRTKAEYINKLFLEKKERFVTDTASQKFFSPHLYRAALSFLEQSDA